VVQQFGNFISALNKVPLLPWYKDASGHILESSNRIHRLIFCPLCGRGGKLVSKSSCTKLRQNSRGKLYPVKRYFYLKSAIKSVEVVDATIAGAVIEQEKIIQT
jgi:hypothetical protein